MLGLLLPLALGGCDGAEEREAAYFERGKTLFEEGNLIKARIEFKNARQINPLNTEALYYLGLIAEKEKNFKAAFGAFRKVVQQEPKHLGGNIRYGRYLLLGGKTDEAIARAEAILQIDPDNAEGHALRGAVYLQKGNISEARIDALAARKADPSSETGLTLLVGVLQKEGKSDEAVAVLRKGIEVDAKNVSLWRVLVELHRLRGDIENARTAHETIIKLEPAVHQHRVNLARLLIGADRKDAAEQVLRQGISEFPNDPAPKQIFVEFLISRSSMAVAETEIKAFIASEPKNNEFRFALARLYAKHRKFDSAESVLKEVEGGESQPDTLKAKTTLARFRLREGDVDAARELVKSVLTADPANGNALTTQARLFLRDGNDVDAIANLRKVLRDNPNSAEAHRLLAEAHLRAGEFDLAADSLRKALIHEPGHDASRLQLVRIYTRQKNYDQALDLLEQAIIRTPNSLALHAHKVEILIAKRDVRRAFDTAKKLQARSAKVNSPLGDYALGRAHQAAGRHDQAAKAFERALVAAPKSQGALRGFVGSKLAQKRTEEAITYLEGIREDASEHVFALNMLGGLYSSQKLHEKAEKAFLQASEKRPEWRAPYINLGRLMLARQEPARAVTFLKKGLTKLPDDAVLQFSLGNAHLAAKDYDAALAAYEAVLAKQPNNKMAANNVAAIIADHKYSDAKSLGRALQLAQAQRDSKIPYFLDTLGWVHYRRGDFNLAIVFLKQAVDALPTHAYMNYHLAMAYHKNGDQDSARTHLEKAVTKGASYPELDKARELLKSMM
jgi:tetratricopeptide (TPR) repeat protein